MAAAPHATPIADMDSGFLPFGTFVFDASLH